MARTCNTHRTYKGWDVFYERHHTGLHWTGRTNAGDKVRADTLAGLREAISLRVDPPKPSTRHLPM